MAQLLGSNGLLYKLYKGRRAGEKGKQDKKSIATVKVTNS